MKIDIWFAITYAFLYAYSLGFPACNPGKHNLMELTTTCLMTSYSIGKGSWLIDERSARIALPRVASGPRTVFLYSLQIGVGYFKLLEPRWLSSFSSSLILSQPSLGIRTEP